MSNSSPDISVFVKNPLVWEPQELKKSAAKFNLNLDLVKTGSLNNWQEINDKLGKIVIWRSSNLTAPLGRAIFLDLIKTKIVFNQAVVQTPFIAHKLYQQKILETSKKVNGIKTFYFRRFEHLEETVSSEILKFPFIVKKDIGSQGKGVCLIKSKKDLDPYKKETGKYIFQNFIKNNGDYRVLVFGGKVLGMMKRISADQEEFRNNISLGGKAQKVRDKKIVNTLTRISLKTASLFNLQLCGVDIIYDQDQGNYSILEVNTVPQWRGLQKISRLNISQEMIKHCKQMLHRDRFPVPKLVKSHYRSNYRFLAYEKLHYISRHYLWFGLKTDLKRLRQLEKKYYIPEKLKEKFDGFLQKKEKYNKSSYDLRHRHLKKYPGLKFKTRLMFYYLRAKTSFGIDIKNLISEYLFDDQLVALQKKILADEKGLQGLSTVAINYLYLSRYYLGKKSEKIPADYLLEVARKFDPKDKIELRLKIYFLTHCIIGETLFYTKKISAKSIKIYQQFAEELEKIIRDRYFEVTLDNKFEFLVAAKLCNYQSSIRSIIESEAENSLSQFGNYLIDQLEETQKKYGDNLLSSEHRNILYLMAMFPRSGK